MKDTTRNVFKWTKTVLMWTILLIALSVIAISGLTAAKVTNTLVVVSGSMEPAIGTGSLIVARPVEAATLKPGDVASLQRNDGVFVTHRVIENEEAKNVPHEGVRSIRMKGDANATADPDPYLTKTAFTPMIVVPFVGSVWAFVMGKKLILLAGLAFIVAVYVTVRYLLPFGGIKERKDVNEVQEDAASGFTKQDSDDEGASTTSG